MEGDPIVSNTSTTITFATMIIIWGADVALTIRFAYQLKIGIYLPFKLLSLLPTKIVVVQVTNLGTNLLNRKDGNQKYLVESHALSPTQILTSQYL